jgi:hypothetical protein
MQRYLVSGLKEHMQTQHPKHCRGSNSQVSRTGNLLDSTLDCLVDHALLSRRQDLQQRREDCLLKNKNACMAVMEVAACLETVIDHLDSFLLGSILVLVSFLLISRNVRRYVVVVLG